MHTTTRWAESFFATLECELLDRRSFQTKTEARTAMFTYIEAWYNARRRHSGLGYLSPANSQVADQTPTPHGEPGYHRRRLRGMRHAAGG